ncbi:MAG: bifunctional riboflavin kinase/FAD synthetase [Ruminococcaceae bacterium]|nr:bifunctional riboflavin kinase/FAD synthetase [Oscillospiraceae bacterium]
MRSYNTNDFYADSPTVVALGCFDGVHKGHREVVSEAVRIAKEKNIKSAVFTFSDSPRNFFSPGASPTITEPEEKKRLMRSLGVDIYISVPFDERMCQLSAEDFFYEIIIKRLSASHVVCGFNYSFGKNGRGSTDLLSELCRKNLIGFTSLEQVNVDGEAVSASAIRRAVSEGDMESAMRYLGRPFSISVKVTDGQKLARRLGFPTINQTLELGRLVPRHGVYLTRSSVGRRKYYGITNVGTRPTVGGGLLCAETHLFSFSGDLYGKRVKVEFLRFIRDEVPFSSVDDLAKQVAEDINNAKKFIKKG